MTTVGNQTIVIRIVSTFCQCQLSVGCWWIVVTDPQLSEAINPLFELLW